MSVDDTLAEVVAACRDRLRADAAVEAATARRDRAIWRLVKEDGVPARQAPDRIVTALLEAGFTADQVRGLGVSYGSVRVAVERPRA